jgi:uncharacterized membrane protein
MTDAPAAVLLLVFAAIAWTLLTALVKNAGENTKDGRAISLFTAFTIAAAMLGSGLVLLLLTGAMADITDALKSALHP